MSKTKLQIINETANAYTSKTRAISDGNCMYLDERGNRCAVGMRLRPYLKELKYILGDIDDLTNKYNVATLDELLQDEFKGHEESFWNDIQDLHDNQSNWDLTGLSKSGKLFVENLKEKWVKNYG